MSASENKTTILGGVVAEPKEKQLDQRVDEILSVSRVVQAHPILITAGQEPANKCISCIHSDEFSKIRSPEDLIARI